MIIPKLAIWRGFPFKYRDVGQANEAALEVVQYTGGPLYDIVENSRGPSPIRVKAEFLGPTADIEKAGFLKIAELTGPGVLIHPDFGIFTAHLKSWPESSTGTTRGVCAIDLEFIPVVEVPGSDIAFAAALSAAQLVTLGAAALEFVANSPDLEDSAANSAVTAANSAVSDALAGITDLVSSANQNTVALALDVAAVAATGDTVAVWQSVTTAVDTRQAAQSALAEILDGWQDAINLQTSDYTKGITTATMYEYVAASMIGRYASLTLGADWETYDDAADAAATMYSDIGTVIEMMAGNGVIRGALAVRGAAYAGLMTDALKLPKRLEYSVQSVMSSVELAFRLYGDMARADELETDNNIVHPGFIPAGVLRVLSE